MKFVLRLILFIAVALAFAGCGKKLAERITGRWQMESADKETIEFFPDGTFVVRMPDAGPAGMPNMSGRWAVTPEGRMKIDVSMMGMTNSQVRQVSFDHGDLVLTGEDGHVDRHKRLN